MTYASCSMSHDPSRPKTRVYSPFAIFFAVLNFGLFLDNRSTLESLFSIKASFFNSSYYIYVYILIFLDLNCLIFFKFFQYLVCTIQNYLIEEPIEFHEV